jgi:hypothetical protein
MSNDDSNKPSIFAQYIDKPEEEPLESKISPPANPRSLPLGRLLNWLLNYWTKPTISARDIYTYGPRPIKNLKEAIGVAEIMVRQGWLVPIQAHRHDRKTWLIVRKNEQIGAPRASSITETSNQTTIA